VIGINGATVGKISRTILFYWCRFLVKVTDLMTKGLVNVPGKEVTMITVDYPPGGADPVHRHNASAFIYVLEGTIVMQMKGGEKVTLHPGDTFYEDPEGIHLIGKNASDTKPAKFSS
jgi:quercetin dioxygenase-like cupin family protein